MKSVALFLTFLLISCTTPSPGASAMVAGNMALPAGLAHQQWPVIPPLAPPEGLRPCCAFGYNIRARVLAVPVPFFQLENVVAPEDTGTHRYNDSGLNTLMTPLGLSGEHNGIVYTRRGGFIDLAHVRDTADNTLWLFSQIWPRLGNADTFKMDDELGQRVIRLWPFTPPAGARDRYNLAVRLAAHLAFQLAAWHEVAQWYGFESVPGYDEGVSAFSPEDLYSNLLGARIAIDVLNAGGALSVAQYQRSMAAAIPQALRQLQAVSPPLTRFYFDMLDGHWWNSHCRVPDKFLVRYRNYSVSDHRLPSRPADSVPELLLTLPDHFGNQQLSRFARLEIWTGEGMKNLPAPPVLYRYSDFPALARAAQRADELTLNKPGLRCQ